MRYHFLLGCLILSGFAGLAYELLWVRLLALSFGSTAASFSTVLAVFFGGLAIGSLVGGRLAKRIAYPVRAYALLELGTGIAGLVLYPILVGLESTFSQFDPGPGSSGTFVRFIVATSVLIVPTVLMGATLPFVTRAMVVRDEEVGRTTAFIYAFNTLGACTGAYVTTFWLLPYLGVFSSTLVTVLINVVVFAVVLGLGRNEAPMPKDAPTGPKAATKAASAAAAAPSDAQSKLKVVGTSLAAVLGFAAVALQVVWVRMFAVAMEGTVYGTGSVLISVLVGIGAGSLLLAPFLKRSKSAGLAFVGLQIGGLALVLLQIALLPWITYELGALQIQRLSTYGLHLQMLIVVLAVLGPSVCSGASLPLIIGIIETRATQSARTVGNVYAANTVGAILGSLITGFVVLPSAGSQASVLLAVTALGGAAAIGALFFVDAPRPWRLAIVPVGLLLVGVYDGYDAEIVASGPAPGSFSDWYNRAQAQKRTTLLFSEAKTANVRVGGERNVRSLSLNSLGQGSRTNAPPHLIRESLMMAVTPLSHTPKRERALLVGLGAGVTVDAMLKLGVQKIEVVELEPKVVDAVKVIFGDDSPLDADQVEVIINDARHFLNVQRGANAGQYDVIASMPAHPWVASPIFTREFFEIVKANLSEGGIFCSWFGLGKMDTLATNSLLRAFSDAFDHYIVYYLNQNGAYYLVGSASPIEVSPQRYAEVFGHPIVKAHPQLENPHYLALRIVASSRADAKPDLKPGPVNTDDWPIVEMLSPTTTPTSGLASEDLFTPKSLDPEMIPADVRVEFLTTLLEEHLGTPGGRVPVELRPAQKTEAKALLERAASFLSRETTEYFRLRLAIVERPSDPGHSAAIAELANPELRLRAARGLAIAMPPDTLARGQAFAALPADTGVLLQQLRELGPSALQRVPAQPPEPDVDPLGWWLWKLAHARSIDDSALRQLAIYVGPKLAKSRNEHLLMETASVAWSAGADHIARAAERWASAARLTRMRHHRQQGFKAAKKRDFAKAADHLWLAFTARPLDSTLRMPLIQSMVEIDDSKRLPQALEILRFQGLSEAYVEFLVAEAKRRSAARKEIVRPQSAPDGAERSTGDTDSTSGTGGTTGSEGIAGPPTSG